MIKELIWLGDSLQDQINVSGSYRSIIRAIDITSICPCRPDQAVICYFQEQGNLAAAVAFQKKGHWDGELLFCTYSLDMFRGTIGPGSSFQRIAKDLGMEPLQLAFLVARHAPCDGAPLYG